jgi:hypothetical protein
VDEKNEVSAVSPTGSGQANDQAGEASTGQPEPAGVAGKLKATLMAVRDRGKDALARLKRTARLRSR